MIANENNKDQLQSFCELTILMPCLNEARTLPSCIAKARGFLKKYNIDGEVLVADNGSTDGSRVIAQEAGARVIPVEQKGYGAALAGGIEAARGRYVIMGDADASYDFSKLEGFVEKLRAGYELVMGNRFKGGIEKGAMPFLHRYLGNPVLSFLGRLFFHSTVGDFHCGLRGGSRAALLALDLQTSGMEYASEMVVRAALNGFKMTEVPIVLHPDGRDRPPHLRTWRDGWRHLRFLLLYSPRWLYLYPGLVLMVLGLAVGLLLLHGPYQLTAHVGLDVHSLLVASMAFLLGLQSVTFGFMARSYARYHRILPARKRLDRFLSFFTLERLLFLGVVLFFSGFGGLVWAGYRWSEVDFGPLDYQSMMRVVILSATSLLGGFQLCCAAFLSGVMQIGQKRK